MSICTKEHFVAQIVRTDLAHQQIALLHTLTIFGGEKRFKEVLTQRVCTHGRNGRLYTDRCTISLSNTKFAYNVR